jgi:hypothetical protein
MTAKKSASAATARPTNEEADDSLQMPEPQGQLTAEQAPPLTPELLIYCARAQHLPIELLEKANDEKIQLVRSDCFGVGGWANLNGWEIEPFVNSDTQERLGWVVQLTLGAWVDKNTLRARRQGTPIDRDRMFKFSMKLQRITVLDGALRPEEVNVLQQYYERQQTGERCAVSLFYKNSFVLQFKLQPLLMKIYHNSDQQDYRLLGSEIFMSGFQFNHGFGGAPRVEEIVKREQPLFSDANALLAALQAGGEEAPVPAGGRVVHQEFTPGGVELF